jgi:Arc/MetJ family transcription regulator
MRISVVVDDALLAEALRLTGLKTPQEVIELALRTLVPSAQTGKNARHSGRA